jgi:DNA-binding HxlR family transcriptional regulator
LDDKIDSYKDNIVVIQDGIGKQVEQHDELKNKIDSYENKVLRLIRNLRFEIEAEINATKDEGTKERLANTVEKINTSLILNLLRELGNTETRVLEEEVVKRNICSKATLFRKLKTLREKELVFKQEKDGTSFYSVSPFGESKEDSLDNSVNPQPEQAQPDNETPRENV